MQEYFEKNHQNGQELTVILDARIITRIVEQFNDEDPLDGLLKVFEKIIEEMGNKMGRSVSLNVSQKTLSIILGKLKISRKRENEFNRKLTHIIRRSQFDGKYAMLRCYNMSSIKANLKRIKIRSQDLHSIFGIDDKNFAEVVIIASSKSPSVFITTDYIFKQRFEKYKKVLKYSIDIERFNDQEINLKDIIKN